jgi:poly-gamma-glutamate synthesis protein (capsule biosynthesis protein)
MTGRGIDQVMAHPCSPNLYEGYAQSALDYVHLAEIANGPIPRGVDPSYIWGAALDEFARAKPDIRIVNLETSITRSEDFVAKGINYRMNPENADCLRAAALDCCLLANNHVLDWGRTGLVETLTTLKRLNIKVSGAGVDLDAAGTPAVFEVLGRGRVLVFSYASTTSGTPADWVATPHSPGVNLLPERSEGAANYVCEQIARTRRPQDLIIVSVHWGPNWGHEVAAWQTRLAHTLIDEANVSIVHGHSSHHAKAMEIYRNRLILYGCGDFLNDYEGIKGREEYRDDLAVMYFADVDPSNGDLTGLELVPLQIRQFSLVRPSPDDIRWLGQTLDKESRKFGCQLLLGPDGHLTLQIVSTGPS